MSDDELGRGGDEDERRHDYDDDDGYEYRHCYTARDVEQRDHELRFDRCLLALRLRLISGQFSNPVLVRRGPRAPLAVEAMRPPLPKLERRIVEHLLTIDVDALDELLTADELRTLAELDAGPLADAPTLAPMLALLRPFWLRDPASWTPGPAMGLIEHLLVAYPYPVCLRNVWQRDDIPALAWMIASAQGGSLQRLCRLAAARGCPGEWPQLTNKLPGLLTQVPASLSLRDALLFAEVLQLGGTELEFRRLHFHFVGWSGAGGDDEQRELAFWRDTVQWFARHREAIEDSDTAPIMTWARHEHTEQARSGRRFRWSGRTPAAVIRAAQQYADELHRVAMARRMQHALSWPSLELDARFELGGEQWSFTELTTSMALCHESARMHHCVHGYAVSCWQRRCAIFSVQRNGRPCLTIELRLPQGRPVQVRGHCNRPPVLVEQAAVNHWAGAYVAVSRH